MHRAAVPVHFFLETLANRYWIGLVSVSALGKCALIAHLLEVESVANELLVQTFRFSVSYISKLPWQACACLLAHMGR